MNRDKIIKKTGIIDILINVLLAAFKAAVEIASNSIAVILDAVNNLCNRTVYLHSKQYGKISKMVQRLLLIQLGKTDKITDR
ncbi:MAG: hypothetical protein IJ770_02480 [Alphaproteobacteria bacterium]|nr:hypothetical protein [Alphaproteobacteria bacterium]